MANINIPGLEKSDFVVPEAPKRRLTWLVWGETKTGKTSFFLSGPRPAAVLDMDHRLERVVKPYDNDNKIVVTKIDLPEVDVKSTKADSVVQKEANVEWEKFLRNYDMALKSSKQKGGVRLVAIDTATELLDLRLMSEFGRLMAIQPRDRGAANADLIELIRRGEKYDATVVWVQHSKDEWKNSVKRNSRGEEVEVGFQTGEQIVDGFQKTKSIVQVVARTSYNDRAKDPRQRFEVHIIRSGVNAAVNARKFTSMDWAVWGDDDKETPLVDYGPLPFISSLICPETSPEDWS